MIEILSSWAKDIILAVIVISILEMILPNNKTKKYVKMVMGIYLLFNIISPIIKNKEIFDINEFNISNYQNQYTSEVASSNLDQTSMDKRLKEIYIDELEKDIKTKLENKGYIVNSCKVDANLEEDEENSGIQKIVLDIEETNVENTENVENTDTSNNQEENNKVQQNSKDSENSGTIEDKIVDEIQKIKKIEIREDKTNTNDETNIEKNEEDSKNSSKLSNTSIRQIKDFLIEEYGVNEKCLKIN